MKQKNLQIEQLNKKMNVFAQAAKIMVPPPGWIKTVRMALGMSQQQLANRLSMTRQSVHRIEKREQDGGITLGSLQKTAEALDMELVYGFVPKDGSLDALIERKARELAIKIVSRTSNTMALEDQGVSDARIEKAIEERTLLLKQEMPKMLWD